ncbi:MAG: methylated-DNA--[protein]-cysteine S-methyltransferase [Myxococcales bacterium]|nr:methylated-DNA--[protein]-cysteine S-methyltransferase [Myxococcales bacterium]
MGRDESGTACVVFETAFGECALAWGEAGLRGVALPRGTRKTTLEALAHMVGPVREQKPPAWVKKVVRGLTAHLAGKAATFDGVPLDLSGLPAFRARVYAELARTTAGETLSYADLARLAGSPRATRAVGQALAHNPFAIVVPCHRVLATGGGAGGFSAEGGTTTKARLLAAEGVALDPERDAWHAVGEIPPPRRSERRQTRAPKR